MDHKRNLSFAALALGAVLASGSFLAGSQALAFGQPETAPPGLEGSLDELRQMRREHMKRQQHMSVEERLNQAVADGTITEEQKAAITAKLEEMHTRLKALKDLPKEQWRDAFKHIHEEMQTWSKDNGINQSWWNGVGKEPHRFQPGPRHGFGMKGDFVKLRLKS